MQRVLVEIIRNSCAALAGSLALAAGGAQAAIIDLDLDIALRPTDFFVFPTFSFFQVGQNLTFTPFGAVAIDDGDTARVTFNFADGQAVRALGPTVNEVSVSFLTAGQLANPGTGPTQTDLTFDFSLRFLGVSGDLLLPSISLANQRNIGGGFGPAVSGNFTDSSFLFRGVQFEFANIRDNNAANGVTDPNRVLPRNFDVASFRFLSAEGVEFVENAVEIPEPPTLALMGFGLIGIGWLGRRRDRPRPPGAYRARRG